MKVLVTGASGYIGNYVIPQLIEKGITVIATSTSIEKCVNKPWFNQVTYIPYTISHSINENLFEKFLQPDIIIHLAWEGLPNFSNTNHFENTLFNQYAFLKNLIANGVKHIAITGTCQEYGMQKGCLSEDMPSMPDTAYSLAKDTLRKFLVELNKTNTFTFQWIRLFYMYGEGQYEKAIIPQLQNAIKGKATDFNMSGGEQLRDYLPVNEVANNICAIALQKTINGIINCSSNTPISIKTLVQNYLNLHQYSIQLNLGYYPYPTYEPMEFWGNNNKLLQIINH